MAPNANPGQALLGDWGGPHVSLRLTADGGATEFDCAHGDLGHAVVPDRNGRFDVAGRYIEEHGGPQREGELASYPVRYAGRVADNRMTLIVTRSDTKERLGTFTLARDREPEIVKCR
jgi:hypothetical protein